jgi:NADH dehydrogenase
MPIAFIAGATGYTGQRLVAQLRVPGSTWTARPHARTVGKVDGAIVCEPDNVPLLTEGLRGCDAVVQLIGTVRKNFDQGDYEKIDYGTTVALGQAAKAAGVPRFLLLSSTLAGTGLGSYLAWKKKTEEWVIASGLEYTVVRPSMITGPGRERAGTFGRLVGWSARLRGIDVEDLARVFVHALERRELVRNQILEGKNLWELVR